MLATRHWNLTVQMLCTHVCETETGRLLPCFLHCPHYSYHSIRTPLPSRGQAGLALDFCACYSFDESAVESFIVRHPYQHDVGNGRRLAAQSTSGVPLPTTGHKQTRWSTRVVIRPNLALC